MSSASSPTLSHISPIPSLPPLSLSLPEPAATGTSTTTTKSRKPKVIRSCLSCHARKVKCSLETPACTACIRHARTLGEDPALVVCEYAVDPSLSFAASTSEKPTRKRERENNTSSEEDEKKWQEGRRLRRNVKRRVIRPDSDTDSSENDEYLPPTPPTPPEQKEQEEVICLGTGRDPRRASMPAVTKKEAKRTILPTPSPSPPLHFGSYSPDDVAAFASRPTFALRLPPNKRRSATPPPAPLSPPSSASDTIIVDHQTTPLYTTLFSNHSCLPQPFSLRETSKLSPLPSTAYHQTWARPSPSYLGSPAIAGWSGTPEFEKWSALPTPHQQHGSPGTGWHGVENNWMDGYFR